MPSNEYISKYRKFRRQKALEFLGGKCNNCESVEDLQFDHIDPKCKEFEIADGLTINRDKFLKELSKCQLLCKKCHLEKSIEEGSFYFKDTYTGEDNGRSVLKESDILEIRTLYKTGNYTQRQLGKLFNVHHTTIGNAVRKVNWKHL